jgi:hypothetical protein
MQAFENLTGMRISAGHKPSQQSVANLTLAKLASQRD